MSGQVSSICQYHKTGFCKYREKCRNNHIDEICKNAECNGTCKERHPKECKQFKSKDHCRFKEACAYIHLGKEGSINQNDVNEAVANVTIKHESEISNLKDEVESLKVIIKEMENKINSIIEKDMTITEEAVSDMTQEKDDMEKRNRK